MKSFRSILGMSTALLSVVTAGCRDRHGSAQARPYPQEKVLATEEKTVMTPDGPVSAKVTTINPFPQKVQVLKPGETAKFTHMADGAVAFVQAYGVNTAHPTLKDCDDAFAVWQESPPPRKYKNEDVVETLGAALGERCAQELGMQWVLVTDKYGKDYAVKAADREVIAFPFSAVQKRIESGESKFLEPIFSSMKGLLQDEKYAPRR